MSPTRSILEVAPAVPRRFLLVGTLFLVGLAAVVPHATATAGDLTVYYSWGDREASAILDAFEQQRGITVDRMRRSTRTIVKLLELERDAPVASVLLGGPVTAYEMGVESGVFAPYVPRGTEDYPPELEDPDHYWHAFAAGVIGFGTDPDSGLKPPQSWDDLLASGYAGQVVYADPSSSGTGYTILSALIDLYGEDGAYEYLTRLDDNVAYYPEGGAMAAHLVRIGIGGVAIAFVHDLAITTPRAGEKRLLITVPGEGTGWELGCAALIAGAPSPELGRELLDFVRTPEAQELLWREVDNPMYPVHPDAAPPPRVPPLDAFRLLPMDWEEDGRTWDQRARRWFDEVGSRRGRGS